MTELTEPEVIQWAARIAVWVAWWLILVWSLLLNGRQATALRRLEASMPEWIETRKQVPDHYGNVLAVWVGCPFEKDHGPTLVWYLAKSVSYSHWRCSTTGECYRHPPTHWMELPKPPVDVPLLGVCGPDCLGRR
jgi:hypothetical protein